MDLLIEGNQFRVMAMCGLVLNFLSCLLGVLARTRFQKFRVGKRRDGKKKKKKKMGLHCSFSEFQNYLPGHWYNFGQGQSVR